MHEAEAEAAQAEEGWQQAVYGGGSKRGGAAKRDVLQAWLRSSPVDDWRAEQERRIWWEMEAEAGGWDGRVAGVGEAAHHRARCRLTDRVRQPSLLQPHWPERIAATSGDAFGQPGSFLTGHNPLWGAGALASPFDPNSQTPAAGGGGMGLDLTPLGNKFAALRLDGEDGAQPGGEEDWLMAAVGDGFLGGGGRGKGKGRGGGVPAGSRGVVGEPGGPAAQAARPVQLTAAQQAAQLAPPHELVRLEATSRRPLEQLLMLEDAKLLSRQVVGWGGVGWGGMGIVGVVCLSASASSLQAGRLVHAASQRLPSLSA